jgi:hypothetical protein
MLSMKNPQYRFGIGPYGEYSYFKVFSQHLVRIGSYLPMLSLEIVP